MDFSKIQYVNGLGQKIRQMYLLYYFYVLKTWGRIPKWISFSIRMSLLAPHTLFRFHTQNQMPPISSRMPCWGRMPQVLGQMAIAPQLPVSELPSGSGPDQMSLKAHSHGMKRTRENHLKTKLPYSPQDSRPVRNRTTRITPVWCGLIASLLIACCLGCGANGSLFTKANPFHSSAEVSTESASSTEAKTPGKSKSSSTTSRSLIKKISRPTAKEKDISDIRVVKLPQQPKLPTEVIEQTPSTKASSSSASSANAVASNAAAPNAATQPTDAANPPATGVSVSNGSAQSEIPTANDPGAAADGGTVEKSTENSPATSEGTPPEGSKPSSESHKASSGEEPKAPNSNTAAETGPTKETADTAKTEGAPTATATTAEHPSPTRATEAEAAIHSEIAAAAPNPMVTMHGNMPVTLETLDTAVVTRTAAESRAVIADPVKIEDKLLAVQQLSLVREVKGFGKKTAFASQIFHPGQSVILYAEVDRFGTILDRNGYYTALRGVVVIRDQNGHIVFRQEPGIAEETCESKRRDYYLAQILTFPNNLPMGRYQLEFFVEDCCSGRYGEATIEVEIQ